MILSVAVNTVLHVILCQTLRFTPQIGPEMIGEYLDFSQRVEQSWTLRVDTIKSLFFKLNDQ
jgi:hypothetical protein